VQRPIVTCTAAAAAAAPPVAAAAAAAAAAGDGLEKADEADEHGDDGMLG
jgi:ribosomal protein L12E/L44/L45/RPP1/RPP2